MDSSLEHKNHRFCIGNLKTADLRKGLFLLCMNHFFIQLRKLGVRLMINKKFDKTKKTLAILLILCFILSVTAVSVSAASNSKNKDGYNDGYRKGYEYGKKQGQKDCNQYGSKEALSKIPSPPNDSRWTKYYKESYNKGYRKGYIDSYNGNRYTCLK